MEMSQTTKTALIVAGSVAVGAVSGYYGHKFFAANTSESKKKEEELEKKLKELEGKVKILENK